jgi:hypothetical protein
LIFSARTQPALFQLEGGVTDSYQITASDVSADHGDFLKQKMTTWPNDIQAIGGAAGKMTTPQNKIEIYGPKSDGSYWLELRQSDGRSLVVTVPAKPQCSNIFSD